MTTINGDQRSCNFTGCPETDNLEELIVSAQLPLYGRSELRLFLCAEHAREARTGRHDDVSVSYVRDAPPSVECGAHKYTPNAAGICTGCGGDGYDSHWGHRAT